jgi:VWFA-related protein
MRNRTFLHATLCVTAAALLLGALNLPRLSGQEGQGPSPGVSETVLAPKKTAPEAETKKAPAQEEKKPERIDPDEVFTVATETRLVNVDVLVLDSNNNPIPNLGQKNFRVLVDGVPQTVTNFASTEAPMTVAMLIEFSNRWWGFLYLALRYSYDFVNVLEPKDWVAVVTFDMNPTILQDFTQNRHEVLQALDRLRFPGFSETNMYDAIAFLIDRMKDIQGRKAILFVGTGIDTFSKLNYGEFLKIVRQSETAIYPISILEFVSVRYGENINTAQARNALNTVAKYSGGQAYFPRFEQQLPAIYNQIAHQLRMQYSLGFIPSQSSEEGKFRKLKVELVDENGSPLQIVDQRGKKVKYKVVAREGYYEPKA